MSEKLEKILKRIRENNYIRNAPEAGIRQAVILPILEALDWDVGNLAEVKPEYNIGPNRVDFCLLIHEKSKVFIEAKAASEDLDRHREQLLNYSFQHGVPLAILTNGIKWSFFLPLREGIWTSRNFLNIDLLEDPSAEIDCKLESFLKRSSVVSGTAISEAKKIYESAEMADAIERALPTAWNQIIRRPDDLLVDLLIEEVEEICQHRPDSTKVEGFVLHLPSLSTSESPEVKRKPENLKKPIGLNNQYIFPASVPRAFIDYGALSIKAPYRPLLPANQESIPCMDRTFFTTNFQGHGETQAYMSQGRLKISDKSIWREIVTKIGIQPNDTFMVKVVKPYQYYEVQRQ